MIKAGFNPSTGKALYRPSTGKQCIGCCVPTETGLLFVTDDNGSLSSVQRAVSYTAAGIAGYTFTNTYPSWKQVRVKNSHVYVQQAGNIRKYDFSGTLITTLLTGLGTVYDFDVDSSDNIYLALWTSASKYNSSGVLQWTVLAGFYGQPYTIRYDENTSNTYIGRVDTPDTIESVDSGGNRNWISVEIFPNGACRGCSGVTFDSSGNVYGVMWYGYRNSTSYLGAVKYNSSGVQQWLVGSNSSSPIDTDIYGLTGRCAYDSTNGLLIASGMRNVTTSQYILIAFNVSDGSTAWQTNGTFVDVTTDPFGYSYALKSNGEITKRDGSGVVQWTKNISVGGSSLFLDFER